MNEPTTPQEPLIETPVEEIEDMDETIKEELDIPPDDVDVQPETEPKEVEQVIYSVTGSSRIDVPPSLLNVAKGEPPLNIKICGAE